MKPVIAILLVALAGSLPAYAKQPGDKPDIEAVISQLQLDSARAEQLTQLVQDHHEEMKSQRDQRHQQRSKIHEMREQHREELLGILNHEQLYQFEKLMREQRHQHRGNRQSAEQ